MDLPKAPTSENVHAASGTWNWIVFFVGLVVSGGLLEYLVSKRYVTRKEWDERQLQCTQHLKDQFKIALLENNTHLEQRMITAVSNAVRDTMNGKQEDAESDEH